MRILPACAHVPHREQGDTVVEIVEAWLALQADG
jgi:hypothetical protein